MMTEDFQSYMRLLERRSVKGYTSEMPPKETLAQIVEAGMFAASGMNRQPTKMIVVTAKDIREKLVKTNAELLGTTADPFYGAPAIVIVLADSDAPTYLYDGSLVMGNLMQAAHDLGIGSCWIHRAKETFELPEWREWLRALDIPDSYVGIGHVALGYADAPLKAPKPRKENRIHWVE